MMRLKSLWLSLLVAIALGNIFMLPEFAQASNSDPAHWLVAGNEIQILSQGVPCDRTIAISDAMNILVKDKVGTAGVAARPVEGGCLILLNAKKWFPMASTVKVPIAMALLDQVDAGNLRLDKLVEIDDSEWVLSPVVASEFVHPGVALSVANLIEVMITQSDNTTTDVCLRLVGGPDAVDDYVTSLGIKGMDISRYMRGLLENFYGLASGRENIPKAAEFLQNNPEKVAAPNQAFEADPRDQVKPPAMLDLLLKLFNGDALSPDSTQFLLGIMGRTKTGSGRLKGLLPSGILVEHKTGTVGGVANDVGYIRLPDGRRMAIAVFTKTSTTAPQERDRAIAEIGRLLFDVYLTETPQLIF
ncbi:MAG: class A beta-lactamase [Moorea sp. SIO4E2]|uniref:class A beta-lactamase n=1 Tax=Moorena sp. SIO4E2 TaxID=2607826 RepID=UPI0013BC8DA9|nr:class A beta-lactamase [Moorena sp. SIO4E2]NEQ05701.1 class A beta-lactamase [Moorena sp. SIO4E2]